ncbi:MAG: ATP-binding cassette, subfamily bacterial [Patescibacteria group bacterium]|nr:ATP-binding cassette, subfamily bacterial [Patescibacteria group bacterium]
MKNYIKNIGLYLKVVKEAAPYSFISLLIVITLMQGFPFYISKIQSEIIDGIIEAVKTSNIITTGILSLILTYISVQLLSGLAGSVKGILISSGNYKIQTLFEFKVLKKYLDLDIARYEDPDFRKLLQKGVDGGNQWSLHRLGMITYNLLFPALVKISISASIILFFDWKLFFIIIFAEVPPILNRIFFDKKEYSIWAKKETETQMRYFDLRGHIRNKSARTELKIYQIGGYILGKIKSMYDSTTGAVQEYEQKRLYINIFADIISAGAYGWAIYQTILHTLSGDITVGYMTFIFGAIFTAGRSVSEMLSAMADITEQNRYATHVREFFETESILKTENPTAIELKINEAPLIRFENVTFQYPSQSKEIQGPILKNINVSLHPGEKIGLIGDNGAGKSTFIKLLLRIYDPSEGSIFINGVNLKNIPPEIWQTYISALMQDFVNYNFTIKEAIAISQQPNFLDEKKVQEAAKQSQAYTFIEKYEHGYDAQIGTDFGGIKFSGGQSQKMALARTFYRKAPIVILDEPTAAVDTESEIEIFKTLDTLGDKTTAIFISHDMATIGRASRIIVLDKGSVIEDGNHESLMKTQDGKYRRMYEEQVKAMVK